MGLGETNQTPAGRKLAPAVRQHLAPGNNIKRNKGRIRTKRAVNEFEEIAKDQS